MRVACIVVWTVVGLLGLRIAAAAPAAASNQPADIHQQLRDALAGSSRKRDPSSLEALNSLITSASFAELSSSDQHVALLTATQLALQLQDPGSAQRYAKLACALPERTVDDLQLRLRSAQLLGDVIDQTQSLTEIAKQGGGRPDLLQAGQVLTVLNSAGSEQYQQYYFEALHALYDAQWASEDQGFNDELRLSETLMWLQAGDLGRAASVAQLITDPSDLITLQVDSRFKPLFGWRSHYLRQNLEKAQRAQLDSHRRALVDNPHSIRQALSVSRDLQDAGQAAEALKVAREAEEQLKSAGLGPKDIDMQRLPYLLMSQADALQQLGRSQDALDTLHRAIGLERGNAGASLDLAEELAQMGDTSQALQLMPADSNTSAYGKMVAALVRVTVASQQNDTETLENSLLYLQKHAGDGRIVLLRALVRANRLDDAGTLLLQMLRDPIQRLEALRYVQSYPPPASGGLESEWQRRFEQVRQRSDVVEETRMVGSIESFPWHPPFPM